MKKLLYFLCVVVLAGVGCTDSFEDLNTDKKRPTEIPAEPLFSNATRNLSDLMADANVNRNVFRLYSQYWAQTTYPDESQYNMVGRDIPGSVWDELYRDVLKDLDEAKKILNTQTGPTPQDELVLSNKKAIIDLVEGYTYTVLVDVFGDVPFSQALDADNLLPAYDPAKSVYTAAIAKIDNAAKTLDASAAGYSSAEDIVYGGDVAKWKTFANSLLLKLAMRIADTDAAGAQSMVSAAAGNVMTSDADNFAVDYYPNSPNTNPLHVSLVLSGRNDFVPANTIVDMLNNLEDPRRDLWFTKTDTTIYIGGVYGTANAYSSYSHLGPVFEDATLAGTMMSYSEVEFLLAEAAERGMAVDGSAEEHYNAAVAASIMEWGGTQDMVDAYMANPDVAYSPTNLGVQKWISLFNNGFEGWSTVRSFDLVGMLNEFPADAGITLASFPNRLIYPLDEPTLNGANHSAAAANYGGDVATARIFWDAQ